MTQTDEHHLVQLGATGWYLWRDVVLRSAGFPAAEVLALGGTDPRAADGYELAVQRMTAALRAFAAHPRFREAVAWQNRKLLPQCLDRVARGEPRNAKGRNNELTVASYAQRYCVKNDTIGFFGPVGWATWQVGGDTPAVAVTPGPTAVHRRAVYFEQWAVDALAQSLGSQAALRPWLTPYPVPANHIDGRIAHLPGRPVNILSELEAELLELMDGRLPVRDIAQKLGTVDSVWPVLTSLRDRGLIRLDLLGPIETHPEVTLRAALDRIDDPAVRGPALAALDELVCARDRVAAAAGDADGVAAAIDELGEVFERLTGSKASRRPGQAYAGRSLLYEDTVLNTRVELGRPLLEELAPPLSLVLDSVRWFAGRAAERYSEVFDGIYQGFAERTGETVMPLATFIGHTTPYLSFTGRGALRPLVSDLVKELQAKWARVLGGRHEVAAAAIEPLVHKEFAGGAAPWPSAVHHSPDIMIAARDLAAIARGDYSFVLGELHVATNTVDGRLFVAQHESPERLLAAHEADYAGRRVCLLPSREWEFVNSRTGISVLQSPGYTYWSLRADAVGVPGRVLLPVAALGVHRHADGRLVVRDRRNRQPGLEYSLMDFLGELISPTVADAFQPVPPAPHRPRVSIGRLVVCRESWTVAAGDIGWATLKDERERYRQCQTWRKGNGIPLRAFYRVPVEGKPIYVDFSGLGLINLFAKAVRRSAEHSATAEITITELLPDISQAWLAGADGARYTSELRLVAVHGGDRR